MPTVTFLRHCESIYNKKEIFCGRTDSDVTKEGLEKAKKSKLINKKFDVYYCSGQKRTKKTLEAIFPNAEIIEDNRLLTMDLGDWEGKLKSSIDKELILLYKRGEHTPPNGENPSDVDKRVCDFVIEIFNKYQNENILVVTSNGVIRSVKRNFLNDYNNVNTKNLGYITMLDKHYIKWREKYDN